MLKAEGFDLICSVLTRDRDVENSGLWQFILLNAVKRTGMQIMDDNEYSK